MLLEVGAAGALLQEVFVSSTGLGAAQSRFLRCWGECMPSFTHVPPSSLPSKSWLETGI